MDDKEMSAFKKAWLYTYAAAGENIGFVIRPAKPPEAKDGRKDKTA